MFFASRVRLSKGFLTTLTAVLLTALSPALSAATATVEDVRAIARLYSAAFDREPLPDGLNFWVGTFEGGASLTQIAGRFNAAPEFAKKYGPLGNTEYVEQLFRNVLGRDGAREGIDFWVGNLEDGVSRAKILENFSESPENVTKTTATFADMRLVDGAWTFESIFTNNLIATGLDISTPFPRIGYPLELTIDIEAVEPTTNVTVALFAIDKDRENTRQLVLDTATIDLVVAGNGTYFFEVEVPTSLEIAGPYFIGALVDAADFIGETNEADNEASIETTLAPAEDPNLIVESLEPDRNAIVLDRDSYSYAEQAALGVVNSDAGGTLSWRVNGAPAPIDVEVFATLKLNRSDTGTAYSVPLYLWNSDEQRYMNAYGMDPQSGINTGEEWLPIGSVGQQVSQAADGGGAVTLSEFDPRSAHLDFYFPGGLASELEVVLRNIDTGNVLFSPTEPPPDLSSSQIAALNSFLRGATASDLDSDLCVEIRPADPSITEEDTRDNLACAPMTLVLPPPQVGNTSNDPVFFETGFSTEWGGDTFGFGLDFAASASADNRGVILMGTGEAPMQVFGIGVEFMAVESRAQILPLSERDNPPPGQEPGFYLELRHLNQSLAYITLPDGRLGPLQLFFTKEFKGADKIVTVGPVPVKLNAALTGNLGAEYTIIFGPEASNGVALEVAPFVNVNAGASAAVTIGVADVGVEGGITLVEEKFKIQNGSSINVLDDSEPPEIVYVPRQKVTNELTGARGALSVFVAVSVPTVKKCSWGLFTGLCPGLKTLKYPYTLAQWTAFTKTDVLFDESIPISVVTLPDGSASYRQ